MKRKYTITWLLTLLVVWAGASLADDFISLPKIKVKINSGPVTLYQCDPLDSVLVIKGKVDMGQTDYYSVFPKFMGSSLKIDGKPIEAVAQEIGFYKGDVVLQFKSSQAAGWAFYFYTPTGSNPTFLQKFKEIKNVTWTSSGTAHVVWQQNGNSQTIAVLPGAGTTLNKAIGPMQPK